MDKFYHSVRLESALCKGCINCIKRCPTQAIRVRDGKAQINGKFCIDCGECIRICPHHAKIATYDKLEVMRQYEYTVALPAPSLYSQFNNLEDVNIVLNALKLMGFDDVVEVSGAAEIVSEATRQYISAHQDQIPMAVKKALRESGLSREKIGIFFISPCPSKVTYVKAPLGTEKSEVDHVLAIKEVYPQLLSHMKAVGEDPEEIHISGKIGISWGRSGGEASGLFSENYLAADGIENVIRVLEDLEDEKFDNLQFVELNACNGGCVGGVLTVENPYVAEVKLKRLRKYMPVARSHMEESTKEFVPWTTKVEFEPVFRLGDNVMESFSRLERVERLCRRLPGLDCGSCGAPTCKALAEDIVRGEASERDCVYYLRDNLHKLSQEVAVLAEDLAERESENGDKGRLNALKEYIQMISDEMAVLDSKVKDENVKAEDE